MAYRLAAVCPLRRRVGVMRPAPVRASCGLGHGLGQRPLQRCGYRVHGVRNLGSAGDQPGGERVGVCREEQGAVPGGHRRGSPESRPGIPGRVASIAKLGVLLGCAHASIAEATPTFLAIAEATGTAWVMCARPTLIKMNPSTTWPARSQKWALVMSARNVVTGPRNAPMVVEFWAAFTASLTGLTLCCFGFCAVLACASVANGPCHLPCYLLCWLAADLPRFRRQRGSCLRSRRSTPASPPDTARGSRTDPSRPST